MPRSDDDSWDLLTGVGTTATGIAAARALASKRPHEIINDPFARPLVQALGSDYYLRMADGDLDTTGNDTLNVNLVPDGMAIRTQFSGEFFSDAMGWGLRQAVILACGLDARPLQLHADHQMGARTPCAPLQSRSSKRVARQRRRWCRGPEYRQLRRQDDGDRPIC
jgi:O-methyltransferase involved in polyketide biosynthesis